MDASPPTEKVRVCLIGPKKGGKSHLLSALTEGTKSGAHGFPASWSLRVEPTDDSQRSASASDKMKFILKNRKRTEYHQQASRAVTQTLEATPSEKIAQYDFDLICRRNGSAVPERSTFVVADAAGEHVFPEGVSEFTDDESDVARQDQGRRDDFIDYLTQSDGLVIVLPLHRVQDVRFSKLMDTLVDALTPDDSQDAPEPQLKRISIALNQYERLFTEFGSDAAQIAAVPDVARGVARSRLRDVPFMERMRDLDRAWGGPYDIKVIPTSAYGFLPDFGNPNINPDSAPNTPFIAYEASDGGMEFEQHPFLAADPFVFAASGLENDFMIGIEEIYGPPSADDVRVIKPEPLPLEPDLPLPPSPRRPSLFSRIERTITQFFNP